MSWLLMRRLRAPVTIAALVSFALNVSLLMPAIYMVQVFDRVFSSRSPETLGMLGAVTLVVLAVGYFLDKLRVQTLAWAGRSLERKLAPFAVRRSIEQAASLSSSESGGAESDTLRDISQLRSFLSGPGVLAVFDAPWLPVFLLLFGLMHPALGLAAALGAAVLVVLCVVTDRVTREQAELTLDRSRTVTRLAEKFSRNAEVVAAMGMTSTVVTRWGVHHERMLDAQERHVRSSAALGALARSVRQVLQVLMLALGAWLVIEQQASAGIMIAATVLLSRALQPVEYLISGWRMTIEARAAWDRLRERVTREATESELALPAPEGRSGGEKVTFG